MDANASDTAQSKKSRGGIRVDQKAYSLRVNAQMIYNINSKWAQKKKTVKQTHASMHTS